MPKLDRDALTAAVVRANTTYDALAADLGIDRTTLYRRLRTNTLRICDVYKMCNSLRLSRKDSISIFLADECQN